LRRYGLILCWTLALYGASCAPGILWQDSGLIQYRVINTDIKGFLGLALSHPLFYLLGICTKCIPLGQIAFKVNLISALLGAVTVANLWLLVRMLTTRPTSAIIAAVTLAVSHTFWQHSSMAETYTLWSALFTAELVALARYTQTRKVGYLYWLGLFNGLAMAVHMLAAISLVVYLVGIAVLWRRRCLLGRHVALIAALWIMGCLPYEVLCVQDYLQRGDLLGTVSSALFGNQWKGQVLNASVTGRLAAENLMLWALNFPTPNVALACVGLVCLARLRRTRAMALPILIMALLFLAFAFRYTVADRYAFFIPFYILVSAMTGLGADAVLTRFPRRWLGGAMVAAAILPMGFYALGPAMARAGHLDLKTRGDVPYRDDLEFFITPWKTWCDGPQRFATEVLGAVGRDAVIYADLTTVGPLLIRQQTEAFRPDVAIVSTSVHSPGAPAFNAETLVWILRARPVYVVSAKAGYCPRFVLDGYGLAKEGLVWRIRPVKHEENPCW
jgi:hypothetical protein